MSRFPVGQLLATAVCLCGCAGSVSCQETGAGPAAVQVFVATTGNDANPGTSARPFATLERARDELRRLSAGRGSATVWISGGTYELSRTLRLGEQDSGGVGAPVVWRGVAGQEVRISGGRVLRAGAFAPLRDEAVLRRLDPAAGPHVRVADLRAMGITDYGELRRRGFAHPLVPAALELFFNDRAMPLAGWPNEGFARTGRLVDAENPTTFEFTDPRIRRWVGAEDPWIYGFFAEDWADEYLPLQKVAPDAHQLTLGHAHQFGIKPHHRFRVVNVLEELDEPGEWWLDRNGGRLYFWPPGPLEGARIAVSMLSEPIVDLQDCAHVTLRGLMIENGRGVGVRIRGGRDNLVAGCTLRNLGTYAVQIGQSSPGNTVLETLGGTNNGVDSCVITQTGEGGIILAGGDRKRLIAGGNFATNNHIHHWARSVATYAPAVDVSGVGNLVAHNDIHDGPHAAVLFAGNDNVMEFNDVHDVCLETADAGAFYIGQDLSMRGNVLRYNLIRNVGPVVPLSGDGPAETNAIYLDDFASGTLIEGNVIDHVYRGVQIGGGRDNVVENNIFVHCSKSAIFMDARGISWARKSFDGRDPALMNRLAAVGFDRPPYSERYPELGRLMADEPARPKGNRFLRNICVDSRWCEFNDGLTSADVEQRGNLIGPDAGLVDPLHGDFRVRPDGPAAREGFVPIPLGQIGPRTGR